MKFRIYVTLILMLTGTQLIKQCRVCIVFFNNVTVISIRRIALRDNVENVIMVHRGI